MTALPPLAERPGFAAAGDGLRRELGRLGGLLGVGFDVRPQRRVGLDRELEQINYLIAERAAVGLGQLDQAAVEALGRPQSQVNQWLVGLCLLHVVPIVQAVYRPVVSLTGRFYVLCDLVSRREIMYLMSRSTQAIVRLIAR